MTVKELIKRLQCFDEDHHIQIEAEYDCGYGLAGGTVDDVQYKNGDVVLTSVEY